MPAPASFLKGMLVSSGRAQSIWPQANTGLVESYCWPALLSGVFLLSVSPDPLLSV